jgi:hypothetical protein
MPGPGKSEHEFDRELTMICKVLNVIDAGRADHLFVDVEAKAAAKAEWEAKMITAIQRLVRANSGLFYETPDGKIGAVAESRTLSSAVGP